MSSKSWVVLYCAQALGDAGLAHRDFQPQVERLALGISNQRRSRPRGCPRRRSLCWAVRGYA